jgi:hypothetical protein
MQDLWSNKDTWDHALLHCTMSKCVWSLVDEEVTELLAATLYFSDPKHWVGCYLCVTIYPKLMAYRYYHHVRQAVKSTAERLMLMLICCERKTLLNGWLILADKFKRIG